MALKTFDKSASGITVGVILLIVACGYVGAAAMDILLLSKVCH